MAWVEEAIDWLRAAQRPNGAWGYGSSPSQGEPAVEPTALAAMALGAHGCQSGTALDWLTEMQRSDGGFPVGPRHAESNWATSPAALCLLSGGRSESAEKAVDWLLADTAYSFPGLPGSPYGYDTSLSAWSWTSGDFSWVEPTCLAMLAIRRSSRAHDARVDQGCRLLADRVTSDGDASGWNYGEPRVLGVNLVPAVVPTALAVLALRGLGPDLTAPLALLRSCQAGMSSLYSVGWAANALASAEDLGEAWQGALATAWSATGGSSAARAAMRTPMNAAVMLLAIARPERNPFVVR